VAAVTRPRANLEAATGGHGPLAELDEVLAREGGDNPVIRSKPSLRVLFLGAGKRLSLLECFDAAAKRERVDLKMAAVELSTHVPIASLAEIVVGPKFTSLQAEAFLLATVDRYGPDVVIPNMDSATVLLSAVRSQLEDRGCWAVVSSAELCSRMEDKYLANEWLLDRGVPVPGGSSPLKIAKPRRGYGSRDQFIGTPDELAAFLSFHEADAYFVQSFVEGQEYTVDAYVDRSGRLVAALSRKRLEVVAGEVDVSETHRNAAILHLTEKVLSAPGWIGPITLQFIDAASCPVLIEINPRFGGGVTHSIHSGLDMPRWILRERLGRELGPAPDWPDGSVMTRAGRDVFFEPDAIR
jgi:carbamoyl-phosphate synthase large subunit